MPYHSTARSEQRRQQMRQMLITAAHELFIRQGYEATTMQQIVRAAGTSIGNCYFYFPTKEALLHAIVDDFAHSIGQTIDAAIAPLPPGPEKLAIGIAQAVLTTLARADLARVLLVEAPTPELRNAVLQYFVARLEHFLIEAHFADKKHSLLLVELAWQGAIFQILESAIMGRIEENDQAIARFLVQWNLRALGVAGERIEHVLITLEHFLAQSALAKNGEPESEVQTPEEE